MAEIDTVTVKVQVERKVFASRVDMHVEIAGESLFSGDVALEKAVEVRSLVAALEELGVDDDRVSVSGIQAKVGSSLLTKNSEVRYRLCIRLPSTDLLADAFGVVTSRKNAKLLSLTWQYDGIEATRHDMLKEGIEIAQRRAAVISQGIGQALKGVHTLTEVFRDPEDQRSDLDFALHDVAMDSTPARLRVGAESFGFNLTHAKSTYLDVCVVYRLCAKEG